MLDSQISTWPQAKAAIERGRPAVLPFGAHEQHGPHLPLSTDTLIAAALAARLAKALDAILLPAIPYGETWSTSRYPGTVSLSPGTVQSILVDIGNSLQRQEIPALIVVNGHFGNRAPCELACRALMESHAFPVLLVDFPGLDQLAARVCQSKAAAPGFYHADEVETSLMLAIRPETVHMALAAPEYPVFPPTFGAESWPLDAFCSSGVFGDPTSSSKAKGELLLDGLFQNSLELVYAFLQNHRISSPKF